jgi:hypothetical protein
MKEYKTILRFSFLSIKEELRSVNIYIFLVIIFFVIQFCFSGVGAYLNHNNDSMNIFELYIWFMTTSNSQIIYLIGIFFLARGVVFFNLGSAYYLLRTNKKTWIASQMVYIFFIVAAYNLFLILSLCIACGTSLNLSNNWSNAAITACQFGADAIRIKPIVSAPFRILQCNPNFIGLVTFLLSLLIGTCVGIVIIYFTIKNRVVYGIFSIFGVWFLDLLIENNPSFKNGTYVSPFGLSRVARLSLNSAGPSLWYAIVFNLCLIIILIQVLMEISKKIDFVKLE